MKTTQASGARIEREVEREREQRHKNDDARAGIGADEELRAKDARESDSSSDLPRAQGPKGPVRSASDAA